MGLTEMQGNKIQSVFRITKEDWLNPDKAEHLAARIKSSKMSLLSRFAEEVYSGRHFLICIEEHPPKRWEFEETYFVGDYYGKGSANYRVTMSFREVHTQRYTPELLEAEAMPITDSFIDLLRHRGRKFIRKIERRLKR